MPKIPIPLEAGYFQDDQYRVGSRELYNCYPETNPGQATKTTIRTSPGYEIDVADQTGSPNTGIRVSGVNYYLIENRFYREPSGTSILVGSVSAEFATEQAYMVSNGKTIIMGTSSTSQMWYYDISGGTLDLIVNKDANFGTLRNGDDVKHAAYKDGYYVFITPYRIFHGSNDSSTDGLTFNALSFQPLPYGSVGTALASASGVLYVMTSLRTYLYQTAPTTPFSFSKSIGSDISVGSSSNRVAVFEDRLFFQGGTVSGSIGTFIIEGTSYQAVGTERIDSTINTAVFSSFQFNNHVFIHCAPSEVSGVAASGRPTYVLDYTETKIKGYPVWHRRGVYDGNGGFDNFGILFYEGSFILGVQGSSRDAAIYNIDGGVRSSCWGNSYQFGLTTTNENGFSFSFPFIRNEGSATVIKKVRLRFSDYVTNAELFSSVDGEIFVSLGVIDLTDIDSKTAEWRRLGRYNQDVMFRVVWSTELFDSLNPDQGNRGSNLIEGYFEV